MYAPVPEETSGLTGAGVAAAGQVSLLPPRFKGEWETPVSAFRSEEAGAPPFSWLGLIGCSINGPPLRMTKFSHIGIRMVISRCL